MNCDFSILADHLELAIREAEQQLRLEQAVYGLDAMDERTLQALLAERLATHYQVTREVHYPSGKGRKLSHRERCDLVLSPVGKQLRLDRGPRDEPTLFDPPAESWCEPAEALWLELKIASQFREGGARHPGYGSQWRDAVVKDLQKMEADPLIREAGLVLIVFNESKEVLEKDLELFEDVLARKAVLAGFRRVRMVPISERIGHHLCTIAVWPTLQR